MSVLSSFNLSCVVAKCGNTGFGNCSLDLFNVKRGLFVPKGTKFDAQTLFSLVAQIQTMLTDDDVVSRAHVTPLIKGAEVANIEAATSEYSYGEVFEAMAARVGRTYTLSGECESKAFANFNNKQNSYDFIPIFDGNIVAFAPTTDTDGYPAVKGFALQTLNVSPYTEVISSEVPFFTITVVHALPEEWNNRVTVKATDGNLLLDLKGLQDVKLMPLKSLNTVLGEYHFSAGTCGSTNFLATYGSDLTITDIIATSDLGANIIVDSVSMVDGNLKITLDDTDPDFTAATNIVIEGAAPSVLASNGIDGFEICPTTIPKLPITT